jgi:putative ABC transport system permease protein
MQEEDRMFPSLPVSAQAAELALITAAAVSLLVIGAVAVRTPLLGRMGLRNAVRRPVRTASIVAGLALSAVFVTAVAGLQDSFRASAVDYRLSQVGDIDEAVTGTFTQAQIGHALARLARAPGVQAAAAMDMVTSATLALPGPASTPVSAYLYAVPPGFGRVYGPLPAGSSGGAARVAALGPGQVLLSRSAAARDGARPGQVVRVGFDQITVTATVAAVLGNDPVFTTGELSQDTAVAGVFISLATAQQAFARAWHHPLVPDTIVVKNTGSGGMDDIGPGGQRSRAVLAVLQSLFGVAPVNPAASHGTHAPTYFDTTLIHPLKPTVVDYTGGLSLISSKAEYVASPAAREANWLQPAFTVLLAGAGGLLLIVQCLLLAGERRAESGIARAQGLRRRQVIGALVIEGCGYALAGTALGVPLGAAATAGEIAVLNHLPVMSLGAGAPFQFAAVTFHAVLSARDAITAGCLVMLGAIAVTAGAAAATGRGSIVAALRDLDDQAPSPAGLGHVVTAFRAARRSGGAPGSGGAGQPVAETPARARERRRDAAAKLLAGLARRGLLWLAAGAALLGLAAVRHAPAGTGMPLTDPAGLRVLGTSLIIAGGGLLAAWVIPPPRAAAAASRRLAVVSRRLAITGIGAAWLVYGLHAGGPVLRAIFIADLNAAGAGIGHIGPYSLLTILLDLMLPLAGLLVIVIRNADLPAALISAAARRIPGLAPVSRISMAHTLTHRARAGATVTLLAAITFLVMLLITANTTASQGSQGAGPYTAILTAFLTSYLALGVIFALLAIGIVTSRAVIERRHQTGLLRAVGLSRALVRRCFLLEAALTVTLGLLPAAALAWQLVARVTRLPGHPTPFPGLPAALLLAGGYTMALAATALPARRATRVPPAEALRPE